MATATFVEHSNGHRLYGEWWFTALWALLTGAAIFYFLQRRIRKPMAVALHLSFVVILLGALLTHITSRQGAIHLRVGEDTFQYVTQDGMLHTLPFKLRLDSFTIDYHEGTTSAADYKSYLTFTDKEKNNQQAVVSMNNIASFDHVRFYQSNYDPDGRGSVLAMNKDPWGIPVTYAGYALLFLSLVWMLLDPKGQYRQLLRSPQLRAQQASSQDPQQVSPQVSPSSSSQASSTSSVLLKSLLATLLFFSVCSDAIAAPRVLPKETAEKFGHLYILYNDRICPVETYALDFTKKLYGKRHYGEYTACQVLTGFIFYGDDWQNEPIVRIKNGELKEVHGLPDYTSVNAFFAQNGHYNLGPAVEAYYREGVHDDYHKQAAKIDDQLMMVMELRQGTPFKTFPNASAEDIFEHFALINEAVQAGNISLVNDLIADLQRFQQRQGGAVLPSETTLKAEYIYNAVPFATILFMVNLTLGFVMLIVFLWQMIYLRKANHIFTIGSYIIFFGSFVTLTVCMALRWIISGTIPLSNGYETMLSLAWFIELITLVLYRRFRILLVFGLLLSGFFLLVSHISQMDPQIGRLMPVLRSPLLTIHVGIIMMAFALLSLTFICGLTALFVRCINKNRQESLTALAVLSKLFLYPALTTLGLGIFIGAIWANVSWGNYWSWDPKEVWALITFMVYAVAVHERSLTWLQKPVAYHLYTTLSFLTILMTYFGVNYFLGGMHSYA